MCPEFSFGYDIVGLLMLYNHQRTNANVQMLADYPAMHPNNVTYNHRFYLDNFHVEAFDSRVESDREPLDWPCRDRELGRVSPIRRGECRTTKHRI